VAVELVERRFDLRLRLLKRDAKLFVKSFLRDAARQSTDANIPTDEIAKYRDIIATAGLPKIE
jgi:hypothetical protein